MHEVSGYRIENEVGRGGIGVVYRAVQVALERAVALKMPLELEPSPGTNDRFLREIQALMEIRHPHVIPVLDCGTQDGRWYYAMELLEGATLHELAARTGGLDAARALPLFRQAADALGAVHARGLTHRDVKPANMFVGAGERLTLMDFGLVSFSDAARLTTTGKVMGTPLYLAPELLEGAPAGPSSDVYALGLSYQEALTGESAMPTLPLLELVDEILKVGPQALGVQRPHLPRALIELVELMTARDPHARPTPAQVIARLDALMGRPRRGAASRRVITVARRATLTTQALARGWLREMVHGLSTRTFAFTPVRRALDLAGFRRARGSVLALAAGGLLATAMWVPARGVHADAIPGPRPAPKVIGAPVPDAAAEARRVRLGKLRRAAHAPDGALGLVRALAENPMALYDDEVAGAAAGSRAAAERVLAEADALVRAQRRACPDLSLASRADLELLAGAEVLRFLDWRQADLLGRLERLASRPSAREPFFAISLGLWQHDTVLRPGPAGVTLARGALRVLTTALAAQSRDSAEVGTELVVTLEDTASVATALGVTSWDPALDAQVAELVSGFAASALSRPGAAGRTLGELVVASWETGLVPYKPATARSTHRRFCAAVEAASALYPHAAGALDRWAAALDAAPHAGLR